MTTRSNGLRGLAACALLAAATPAAAGSLQFWETSGAPGTPAALDNGAGQQADVDFDASSAEGGGLMFGPTEIELRPTGSVVLTSFACQLAGCRAGDYVFTPGAAGTARLVVSDPDRTAKQGVHDLGLVGFDAPAGHGSLELVRCNYIGIDESQRTCSAATLATVPEPGATWLLAAGAALLFGPLRRARRRTSIRGER